jgi:hypothetical protein
MPRRYSRSERAGENKLTQIKVSEKVNLSSTEFNNIQLYRNWTHRDLMRSFDRIIAPKEIGYGAETDEWLALRCGAYCTDTRAQV